MPQIIKTTIESVSDRRREYDGPNGKIVYLNGTFAGGEGWSTGTKPDFVSKRVEELRSLIGREGDFEVEPDKEYQGVKQWKLKSWPGKPAPGGFGGKPGGREYIPRYRDTPEGFHEEQRSIHRSVALTQAVLFLKEENVKEPDVLDCAEKFYEWLSQGIPVDAPKPPPEPSGPQNAPPPPRGFEAQPPPEKPTCPSCGKAASVIKGKAEYGGGWVCWTKKDGCGHQWSDVAEVQRTIPGLQTADTLPSPKELVKEKSVYQAADEYIAKCDILTGDGSLDHAFSKLRERLSDRTLDRLAYKDLCRKIARRSIAVASVSGQFDAAEQLIRTLKAHGAIADIPASEETEGHTEYTDLCMGLQQAKEIYLGQKALQEWQP